MLALRTAWRLSCASFREFFFFSGCVFAGVLAVTSVAAMSSHLSDLVQQDASAILAADLRLTAAHPFDDFIEKHLVRPGRVVARSLEFTAMVRTDGGKSLLVGVKAVDGHYPLRGRLELAQVPSLGALFRQGGVVAGSELFFRLPVKVGERLHLGEAAFPLLGEITREPDRVTGVFDWGPRLLMPLERVAETGLVRFGSRIRHVASLRLAPGEEGAEVADALREKAQEAGIRVRSPEEGQPMTRRLIRRFTFFVELTSLLAMLVGGLGVATAVATQVRESRPTIAIMKCLGAGNGQVLAIHFWRALLLSLPGAVLGALAGGLVPPVLLALLTDIFPHAPPYVPPWGLLAGGALFGVVMALLFAVGPLLRIRRVSPGILFRSFDLGGFAGGGGSGWFLFFLLLILSGGVVILAGERRMGLAFLVGAPLMVGFLWLVAAGTVRLLRKVRARGLISRLALSEIQRPEGGFSEVAVGLGVGLATLFTILLLEENLTHQIRDRLPERAPNFFFLDIQTHQGDLFRDIAARHGAKEVRMTPVVRGRLSAIGRKGGVEEKSGDRAWRFHRTYVLTWDKVLPPNNRLLSGRWWQDEVEVGASVEAGMARDLGLKLGDRITFDVQGIPVSAPILSIRHLRWSDMGLNFFVILSPGAMAGAPSTYLATVALATEEEEAMLSEVVEQLPNVSAIATRQVMETARNLMEKLASVIHLVGGGAILSGVMVLVVNLFAIRRRRLERASILRVLGASRRDLLLSTLAEFALLGAVAGVASLVVSQVAAGVVVEQVFDDLWQVQPLFSLWALTWCTLIAALVGVTGQWRDWQRPPLRGVVTST